MAEYTPTTTGVRGSYCDGRVDHSYGRVATMSSSGAEFDRWLAAVVAAAKAEQRDADRAMVAKHKAEFEASIARLEDSIADPLNTISGIEYDGRKRAGQKFAVYALARAHAALSEAVGGENR